MKITLQQLPGQLAKILEPCYWLASDEVLLQKNAADLVRSKAQQQGFSSRHIFYIESHFNWDDVQAKATQRSLFSENLLLELHFLSNKFSDDDKKALALLHKQLNPELCLLILSPKIETAAQKAKWFTALLTHCCFIPIWPIAANQYSSWVKSRSLTHQVNLDPHALQVLCEKTQGHTIACDQFLQQLKLLHDHAVITREQVLALAHDAAQTDLFAFVDVFLMDNAQQTLQGLQRLKHQHTEPVLIVWALARELRVINALHVQCAQGSLHAAFQAQHIWPTRQGLLSLACKHFSQARIYALITQLAKIDLQIKGIAPGNLWLALEKLVQE